MDLEQVRFFDKTYDMNMLLFNLPYSEAEVLSEDYSFLSQTPSLDGYVGKVGITSIPMMGTMVAGPFPDSGDYPGENELQNYEFMATYSYTQACAKIFGGNGDDVNGDYINPPPLDFEFTTVDGTIGNGSTPVEYKVFSCMVKSTGIHGLTSNQILNETVINEPRQCNKLEFMLKSQTVTTADMEEITGESITQYTDTYQDGEYDGDNSGIITSGDDVFYTQENYPFTTYSKEYGCNDNLKALGVNLENVSEIRTICNDGTIVKMCDSTLSIGESTICNVSTDLLYNSGTEACQGVFPMTSGMIWQNHYSNVSSSINHNKYWEGETNKFPEESSVLQIFIDDNLDSNLINNCKFELNTGNITNKAIDDSTGNGNKGLLIGDYKIKKQQKGIPMRRDSFIKVPSKEADNENGAL